MKRVIFTESIEQDDQTLKTIESFLGKNFGDGLFKFNNIEVKTELPQTKNYNMVGNAMYNILFLLEYILKFVFNLLYNSNAARNIKSSPYNISLEICIDFENEKFRLYIFVDDDIYGLIVGKKYVYIVNLIKSILPIMSKIRFEGEVRFFPESKFGNVNDANTWE